MTTRANPQPARRCWFISIRMTRDRVLLRDAYHRAGIPGYWLIDARTEPLDFQILHRHRDRYTAVTPRGGWLSPGSSDVASGWSDAVTAWGAGVTRSNPMKGL